MTKEVVFFRVKSNGRPEQQKEQKVVVDGEQPDRMAWPPSLYFFLLFTLLWFCITPQETGHFEQEGTPQKHLPVQPIVLGRRKLHRTAFMKENGRAQIHARPPSVYIP